MTNYEVLPTGELAELCAEKDRELIRMRAQLDSANARIDKLERAADNAARRLSVLHNKTERDNTAWIDQLHSALEEDA